MIKRFLLTRKMKEKVQKLTGESKLTIDKSFAVCDYYAKKFGIPDAGIVQKILIEQCEKTKNLNLARRNMITELFKLYGRSGYKG